MMRVGFVGLGLIGTRRLRVARELGCQVAFAVDPDPARRDALGLQETPYAPNISQLAEGDLTAVDAIFVAVPHDLALGVCTWAFGHGASVLCEKPMGLNVTEAHKIDALAKAAGRKFGAGFNKRFLPNIAALHALIAEGAFGEIYRLRIAMAHGGRPGMEEEWKLKRARAGGGALIDPGIHLIDLVRHLLGSEPKVTGCDLRRRFWHSDVEDNTSLRMSCGSADVTVEVSLTSWKNEFEIEILASDGFAKVTGRGGNYGEMTLEYANRWFWNGNDKRINTSFGKQDPSFDRETEAFLKWVGGGALDPALAIAADGIGALAVVDDVYSSQAAKRDSWT